MAFGIDDFLMSAAAAVSLANTLVEVVRKNSHKPGEMHALLAEVRTENVKRIDDAHVALNKFERSLRDKGIDLNESLPNVIAKTPFWKPYESYRLGCAKKSLDHMSDSLFRSCEDVNALVRCMHEEGETGQAIVESAYKKHEFNKQFTDANSVSEKISLVREQLDRQREALANL